MSISDEDEENNSTSPPHTVDDWVLTENELRMMYDFKGEPFNIKISDQSKSDESIWCASMKFRVSMVEDYDICGKKMFDAHYIASTHKEATDGVTKQMLSKLQQSGIFPSTQQQQDSIKRYLLDWFRIHNFKYVWTQHQTPQQTHQVKLQVVGINQQRTMPATSIDHDKYMKYIAVGEGISHQDATINCVWDYMDLLIKDGYFKQEQLPPRPFTPNLRKLKYRAPDAKKEFLNKVYQKEAESKRKTVQERQEMLQKQIELRKKTEQVIKSTRQKQKVLLDKLERGVSTQEKDKLMKDLKTLEACIKSLQDKVGTTKNIPTSTSSTSKRNGIQALKTEGKYIQRGVNVDRRNSTLLVTGFPIHQFQHVRRFFKNRSKSVSSVSVLPGGQIDSILVHYKTQNEAKWEMRNPCHYKGIELTFSWYSDNNTTRQQVGTNEDDQERYFEIK